jgi:hypothetical protein
MKTGVQVLTEWFSNTGEGIKTVFKDLTDFIFESIVGLKDTVVNIFGEILNSVWALFANLWNAMADKFDFLGLQPVESQLIQTAESTGVETGVQARDNGGRFLSGRPLLVGESQPEVIFPDFSGKVVNGRDTERIITNREKIVEESTLEFKKFYEIFNNVKEITAGESTPIINTNNIVNNNVNKGSQQNDIRTIKSNTIFDKLYSY